MIFMMSHLEATAWWRLFWWLLAGMVIYGGYGFWHSKLRPNPQLKTTDHGSSH